MNDVGDWLLGLFLGALIFVVAIIVGVVLWFMATGGFSYSTHERIGGVECIVIKNRLTNGPKSVSCPPVQR